MRRSRSLIHRFSFCLLCVATGCASQQRGAQTPTTVEQWSAAVGRDHPLTGRIYAPRLRAFIEETALLDAVAGARWLLLGERHDHPDHHRLQARLLSHWLAQGADRRVGFEMLSEHQAPALEPRPTTPVALASAVGWDASGWPDFALYAPVFEVAFEHQARIVAAHPSRERLRAVMMTPEAPDDAERMRLALDPLPEAQEAALLRQIEAAHCGHASGAVRDAMALGQRYKDAFMAAAMRDAGAPGALIAGRAHVRLDRGVPLYLARRGEEGVVSVAFVMVDAQGRVPTDYDIGAFDYVWFTPRLDDRDPCEAFREQLRRMSRTQHE